MSKPHRAGSFSDLGKGLQAKVPERSLEDAVPSRPADEEMESFSTKLSRGTKRRLKLASGYEDRTVILILEQAIAEYMEKNHPTLE